MNKRGLSQVVTTVLIILLVLVSIILIWVAVRPTIQSAGEQVTGDCVTLEYEVIGCDFIAAQSRVKVFRNIGKGTITGMKFIFTDSLGGVLIEDIDNAFGGLPSGFPPGELQEFEAPFLGHQDEEVNIAPVVGNDIICPVSSYPSVICDAP
jgi:hypothetical protein